MDAEGAPVSGGRPETAAQDPEVGAGLRGVHDDPGRRRGALRHRLASVGDHVRAGLVRAVRAPSPRGIHGAIGLATPYRLLREPNEVGVRSMPSNVQLSRVGVGVSLVLAVSGVALSDAIRLR